MTGRVTILGATGSVGRSTDDVVARQPRPLPGRGGRRRQRRRGARGSRARARRALRGARRRAPAASAAAKRSAGTGIACGAGAGRRARGGRARRRHRHGGDQRHGRASCRRTRPSSPAARIALANKESLVCAGAAFMARCAAARGADPARSIPSTTRSQQALGAGRPEDVASMTLTASGGPVPDLERASGSPRRRPPRPPPTRPGRWAPKININSATLMNKGLELIEAHHLFGIDARPARRARPSRNPIVHGLVHWRDGGVTAGLAVPDMRIPIAQLPGLGAPAAACRQPRLDLAAIGTLTLRAGGRERASPASGSPGRRSRSRRRDADGAQRRERGRGGGLHGRADRLPRHRRGWSTKPASGGAQGTAQAPAPIDEALAIDAEARQAIARVARRPRDRLQRRRAERMADGAFRRDRAERPDPCCGYLSRSCSS